jgi:hypothetical protein
VNIYIKFVSPTNLIILRNWDVYGSRMPGLLKFLLLLLFF